MVRAVSLLSMGGTFLMISPRLRGTVGTCFASAYTQMDLYAPYSYIGAIVLILVVFVVTVQRGAQPH